MERRVRNGLILAGAVAAAAAGAIGWTSWDLRANYVPVRGTVVAVAERCTLEHRSFDRNDNPIEERKGPMACPEADRLRRDGGYGDFRLDRQRMVQVRFVSPADGRAHVGSLRPRDGYLRGAVPGAAVEILAHKSDPEKVGLAP